MTQTIYEHVGANGTLLLVGLNRPAEAGEWRWEQYSQSVRQYDFPCNGQSCNGHPYNAHPHFCEALAVVPCRVPGWRYVIEQGQVALRFPQRGDDYQDPYRPGFIFTAVVDWGDTGVGDDPAGLNWRRYIMARDEEPKVTAETEPRLGLNEMAAGLAAMGHHPPGVAEEAEVEETARRLAPPPDFEALLRLTLKDYHLGASPDWLMQRLEIALSKPGGSFSRLTVERVTPQRWAWCCPVCHGKAWR